MRLSRTLGVLAALGALAAAPAHAQTAPATPAPGAMTPGAMAPGQTTLTPPGSTTGVPLLPNTPAPGGAPALPNFPYAPPTFSTPPGLGGQYGQYGAPPALGSSLSDVFGSTASLPLSLTLGQLTPEWRRMTITGSLDFGTVTQVIASLLGSAGVGVYYTKGQTVSLGSLTYLVTYRAQPRALDVTSLLRAFQSASATSKPPAAETLTAQTPLALTLLNLQSAGSLSDVRAFDLSRELSDSAAAVRAYNGLIGTFGSGGASTPSITLPPTPPRVGRPRPRRTPQA